MAVGTGALVGRSRELGDVAGLLTTSRLVTLTGTGGVGKTSLARAVVADAAARFPDGVHVAELSDLVESSLVGHTVAGSVGLKVTGGELEPAQLVAHLADRQALLVLDNCEHVAAELVGLLAAVLAGCPRLTVLATSRTPLEVRAEQIYQVPPLAVPEVGDDVGEGRRPVDLSALREVDAVALFELRAREVASDFHVDAASAAAVAELTRALDGVPLAIELVAARCRVLSPQEIVRQLGQRPELLRSRYRDVPARQRSLDASIEWTRDLCSEQEHVLWRRLSVFVGGFDLAAAEAAGAAAGLSPDDVLTALSGLVDRSVLTRTEDQPARFRMLEMLRQFGLRELDRAGELQDALDTHVTWFAELVLGTHAAWIGDQQADLLRRLRVENANLRAALERAVTDEAWAPVAMRMCLGLGPLWICGLHFSEGRKWGERALATGAGTSSERVLAHVACAYYATLVMDLEYAERHIDQATALLDDDTAGEARAEYFFGLGTLQTWQGRAAEGAESLAAAWAIDKETDDLRGRIYRSFFVALSHAFAGRDGQAELCVREGLALAERHGESFMRSFMLWLRAVQALQRGEVDKAAERAAASLRLAWDLQNLELVALVFEAMAWIAAEQEQHARCATLMGAAVPVWETLGFNLTRVTHLDAIRSAAEAWARREIGDQAFDRHLRRGTGLGMPHAVEIALGNDEEGPDALAPLTPREQDVARRLAQGLSNRAIAGALVISERTVHGHVENILAKLGLSSRTQVALWVLNRDAGGPA